MVAILFPLGGAVYYYVIAGTEALGWHESRAFFHRSTFQLWKMVHRCVAAGRSNTPTSSISLFKFLKDPVLWVKWVRQVRRTRAQWNIPYCAVNTSWRIVSRKKLPSCKVWAFQSWEGLRKVESLRYSKGSLWNKRRWRSKDHVIQIRSLLLSNFLVVLWKNGIELG